MPAPTRRKVYPNDVYTFLMGAGSVFLLAAFVAVLYYLDSHYAVFGLFSA